MRPTTSVSLIDLTRSMFVAEIATPGCVLAYPTGYMSFASICANGGLMNVSFDSAGEAHKTLTPPFFSPESDPVFDAPAIVAGSDRFFFVSYHGQVYPIERNEGHAVPQAAWSILSEQERRAGWRPGGYYQLLALNARRQRLYVLMHQGGEWTHKESGTQVWAIDTNNGRVVGRNRLVTPADAISVTLDSDPLLFALKDGTLNVYRIKGDGLEHLREVKKLGAEASFMSVPGEG
jgi:methylamine dehydrogenase heavy chain